MSICVRAACKSSALPTPVRSTDRSQIRQRGQSSLLLVSPTIERLCVLQRLSPVSYVVTCFSFAPGSFRSLHVQSAASSHRKRVVGCGGARESAQLSRRGLH